MFKKPESQQGDRLAERLKAISGRPDFQAVQRAEPVTYTAVGRRRSRSVRRSTFKQASINIPGGERLSVIVKNVSDTGARIDFFRKLRLPPRIYLVEPTLKIRCWARVAWQTDGSAGVQFDGDEH